MQIFVYEYADNHLHLLKTREASGTGIQLIFPKEIKGVCHLGDESAPIKGTLAYFEEKKRRRGSYSVGVRTENTEISADALIFADGVFRSESGEAICHALFEIARLKDRCRALSSEIEKLNQAVFRTVIF